MRGGLGLGVVVALAAAACTSAQPAPPSSEPAARAEKQDLRVAVGGDPFLGGTPPAPDLGLAGDALNPGIFETLTTVTPSFGLRAGLAVRWEAESATRWRFELRPGVRFHDGTPMTAAAVVETLRAVVAGFESSESGNVPRRQWLPRGLAPESATADGEHVVRVELTEANLRLAEQLANPSMAVMAPGTRAGDGTRPDQTPTGTGPFRFDSYVPDTELRVSANDDYWEGPPQLTSITFRFGPEEDASRLLATGEVDLVGQIPSSVLAKVSGRTERAVASSPARAVYLLFNRGGVGEWSTLRDDDLRRALALALDRPRLGRAGWPDHAEPNDSLIPSAVLNEAGEEVVPLGHDPLGASALLDRAGWSLGADGVRSRDGAPLTLSLLTREPDLVPMAVVEAMRAQLAEVGVTLEVGPAEPEGPPPLQLVNAATFDLFLDVVPQDDANPCALCRYFSIRPGGQLAVAGVAGAGPQGDALFDQVHRAPSLDAARRVAAELMSVVVADEVVALPLVALGNPWLVSSRVQGFDPAELAGSQRWESVYLTG